MFEKGKIVKADNGLEILCDGKSITSTCFSGHVLFSPDDTFNVDEYSQLWNKQRFIHTN